VVSGVFETMLVDDGRVRLVREHIARLGRAGADRSTLRQAERLVHQHTADATSRLVLRIDYDTRRLWATTRNPPAPAPVRLVTVTGYHPTLHQREQKRRDRAWAAHADAAACGGTALLTSGDGLVGETPIANLFAVIGGLVVTAPARGLLAGVTRRWVLGVAGGQQRPLRRRELDHAEAVFVTNAVRGVVAVTTIDGEPVAASAIVDELHQAWLAL
jgi:branched-chain amino acid aminotransferase